MLLRAVRKQPLPVKCVHQCSFHPLLLRQQTSNLLLCLLDFLLVGEVADDGQ